MYLKPDSKVEGPEKYQIRLSNPVNIEISDHSNINAECDAEYYCGIPYSPAHGVYEFTAKTESASEITWKIEASNPLGFKEGDQLDLVIRHNVEEGWLYYSESSRKDSSPDLVIDGYDFGIYNFTVKPDRGLKAMSDISGYANLVDFEPAFGSSYLNAESTFRDGSQLKLPTPLSIQNDSLKEGNEKLVLLIEGPFENSHSPVNYIELLIEDSLIPQEPLSLTVPATTPESKPVFYNVIIESVRGKRKLKGTNEADAFTFDSLESFTKKSADKIIGFMRRKATQLLLMQLYSLA